MYTLAFFIGGNAYCMIELIYRSRTHFSMFFCAGFAIIILLFVYINNSAISPIAFSLIAMITITGLEFIFGVVFNIILKMNVWDYSGLPMNILGQICLPFSLIWFCFGFIIYLLFKTLLVSEF
jgi:uncharacterized membrane protein